MDLKMTKMELDASSYDFNDYRLKNHGLFHNYFTLTIKS